MLVSGLHGSGQLVVTVSWFKYFPVIICYFISYSLHFYSLIIMCVNLLVQFLPLGFMEVDNLSSECLDSNIAYFFILFIFSRVH